MRKFVRIIGALCVVFTILICLTEVSEALETEFHGRVQSTFVLRDINGFQYEPFDQTKGVQWRQELKFDLCIKPEYEQHPHNLRLDKFFLSYRGAYDAIFDVVDRDAYNDIRQKSDRDFQLGRDDIETENDLREAFVDIISETGAHSLNLRLGRQIVQWGDADAFNVVNVLNPLDNSTLMFFENPEDLATPLWMGRLNYSRPKLGPFHNIGLEFVLIPDIRPYQFAPLDDTPDPDINLNSPYAFFLKDFKARELLGLYGLSVDDGGDLIPYLRDVEHIIPTLLDLVPQYTGEPVDLTDVPGLLYGLLDNLPPILERLPGYWYERWGEHVAPVPIDVRENVPGSGFDNAEYGVRLQAGYGSFVGNLYYFRGHQDFPGLGLEQALTENEANLRHPRQHMYGASFNYFWAWANAVVRGEGSLTQKMSLTDLTMVLDSALFNFALDENRQIVIEDGQIVFPLEHGDYTGVVEKKVYQWLIGFDKDFWIRWLNPHKMINTSWQAYWMHIHDWGNSHTWRPLNRTNDYRFTGVLFTQYRHGQITPMVVFIYDTEETWMTLASVQYSKDGRLFYKMQQMSFWGDVDAISPFTTPANCIGKSEISFRVGYNW